uniref:Uncharacterized protein n=1 Tax=Oryza barthii TaxID=65489 RepID=A0A0D3FI95_9ORYZ
MEGMAGREEQGRSTVSKSQRRLMLPSSSSSGAGHHCVKRRCRRRLPIHAPPRLKPPPHHPPIGKRAADAKWVEMGRGKMWTHVTGLRQRKKPYELQQIETARNRQRVSHRRSGRWRWMQNHDNNTTFSLEAEKPKREPHHPRRSKENHDEPWMKTTTTIPEWSSKGG